MRCYFVLSHSDTDYSGSDWHSVVASEKLACEDEEGF